MGRLRRRAAIDPPAAGEPDPDPPSRVVRERRRPGRRRRWLLRPAIWMLVVLVSAVSVGELWVDSERLRSAVRDEAVRRLSDRLDRPVTLDAVDIDLVPFSVEVWGLEVAGLPGDAEPFLTVPWAEIEASPLALHRRRLDLDHVRVERPRVRLEVYGDGSHNLPSWRPGKEGERLGVYVDRVEVAAAEVGIDHHTIELSVDAEAVEAGLDGAGELHLLGRVRADDVTVRLPQARPLPVDVVAQLEVRRGNVRVTGGEVTAPHARAAVEGDCSWAPQPGGPRKCTFTTRGTAQGEQLAALGWLDELEGEVAFDGALAWRPGAVGWRGDVAAAAATFFDRRLSDVRGVLAADRWKLRLDLDTARYAGGEMHGKVTWEHRQPSRPLHVDLAFSELAADLLLADQGIPVAGFASRLAGAVRYRFTPGEAERGDGGGRVEVTADPRRPGLALAGTAPIAIAGGVISSDAIRLAAPAQSVLADGEYDLASDRGRFAYQVATADVAPLLAVLPVAAPETLAWWPQAGAGEASGVLHLAPGGAWTEVDFDLAEVTTAATVAERAAGHVEVDAQGARELRLDVTGPGGAGALVVDGAVGFGKGAASELTVQAFDWPMAAVHPFLPFALPLDGRISGRLDLAMEGEASRGTMRAQVSPARLAALPAAAADDAERPRLDWPRGLPTDLDSLRGELAWAAGEVAFERLVATAAAGELEISGRVVPATGGLDLAVRSSGLDPARAPLDQLLPGAAVAGPVRFAGRVRGDLERPEVELEATAAGRDGAGPSRLDLRLTGGQLTVEGRLLDRLAVAGGGRLAPGSEVVVDLRVDELGELLAALGAPPVAGDATAPGIDGQVAGRLHLALSEAGELAAALTLDRLSVDVAGHRLVALDAVRARLAPDAVVLDALRLDEPSTGSYLGVAGRIGRQAGAPLELAVDGRLAASWLADLLPAPAPPSTATEAGADSVGERPPPGTAIAGTLRVDAVVRGPLRNPYVEGWAGVEGGSLRLAGFPHALEDVEGALRLTREAVLVERLVGSLAGGRLQVDGRVDLPAAGLLAGLESDGPPLAYRLRLTGEDLDLRYPAGWAMHGASELTLRSRPGGAQLTGRATLDRVAYLADVTVDLEELLAGAVRRRRLEIEPAGGLADAVELDVMIEAPGALAIHNNVADLAGGAELVVRGTLAQPILFGTVALEPGGELVYGGTEYRVTRGQLRFEDPQRLDPELDLVATAEVRDVDVTLDLSGRFERLEARFSSEPPLPESEVFRLLAGGDGIGDPVPFEGRRVVEVGEPAATSAASFLYGQAASVIGERVNDLFGFDKFRIDPLTGSGDNLSTARITVGKRLSKDVFVTYSLDPTSTEDQRLRIEWQIDDDLALVLNQNGDDSYSADARWETSFD